MNKIKFIFKSFFDLLAYFYYKLIFCNKSQENVWLISERGIDARDNGYWFYKYMIMNHPEITVKYIISKDSVDYSKIRKEDVIEYRSRMHYYYFLKSKYLISAEIMGYTPNEQLYYRLNKFGFLKVLGKHIFLQHGITQAYNPYLFKKNTKLDLFICGAKIEHDYMINKYGYSDKEAVLTGFARFDNLTNEQEKIILIMPTWRKWLKYNNSLVGTDFYEFYMQLLNDSDIGAALKNKNYKMIFYPHIVFQKFLKEFSSCSNNIIMADFNNYDVQDLLKRSSLLITDYSSVFFDYAYMMKKVLYYQFDSEKFINDHYPLGYFSYEEDGFGPVVYDFKSLKSYILKFLEDEHCFDNYNDRIDNFFGLSDVHNSERIYKQISNL